jgi:hypothetical protein
MRLPGHVACGGRMIKSYRILDGKLEGMKLLVRPRCRQETKRIRGCELDSTGSRIGPLAIFCEHDNASSNSIKEKKCLFS